MAIKPAPAAPPDPDEWIPVPEVLRLLDRRISKTTLLRWVRSGAFCPPLDLQADRLLWVRGDVIEWKKARPRKMPDAWRTKTKRKK